MMCGVEWCPVVPRVTRGKSVCSIDGRIERVKEGWKA